MRKHGKNQTAIWAFLQGSCALIFLLSGVPEGIELMSRDIADGYAPATALGDANVSLTTDSSRWRQEREPATRSSKEKGTGGGGAAETRVTIKIKPRHLEQHRPKTLFHIQWLTKLNRSLKRAHELHWVAQLLPPLAFFPPEMPCPGERCFGWLLNMYPFVISAPQSASSLWRMKWTVLVKSHFTQAKGAPRGAEVSPAGGMKWSQVSGLGSGLAAAPVKSKMRGSPRQAKRERSKLRAVDFFHVNACLYLTAAFMKGW